MNITRSRRAELHRAEEDALIQAHRAEVLERQRHDAFQYHYDHGPAGMKTLDDGVRLRVGGRITFNVYPPERSVDVAQEKNPHAPEE